MTTSLPTTLPRITLQQAIETGYGDGETSLPIERLAIIPVEHLTPLDVSLDAVGDGLRIFLLNELVTDNVGGEKETDEHWEEALERIGKAISDLERVREALELYRPSV
jgi:hypothetical protein